MWSAGGPRPGRNVTARSGLAVAGLFLGLIFNTAARPQTQDAPAPLSTAAASISQGDDQAALSTLEPWIADHPDDDRARFLRASALAGVGQLEAAAELLQTLAARYPERADIWNNLGIVRARQGQLAPANDALSRAAGLAADNPAIQRNLGDVYLARAAAAYTRAGSAGADRARAIDGLLPALPSEPAPATETEAPATAAPDAGTAAHDNASADATQAVAAVLDQRARAEQTGDFTAWLDTYSDSYTPDNGQSRVAWLESARTAFQTRGPGTPQIAISQVHTEPRADGGLDVRYVRQLNGEAAQSEQAVFAREDGHWRIRAGG